MVEDLNRGRHWCHGRVRGCGFRMTMGREAVLDVLSRTEDHLSAEDIYMRVHETYPAIGLTSVYRTLDMLVNIGLVYKFDFGDGRARFEIAEGPKGKGPPPPPRLHGLRPYRQLQGLHRRGGRPLEKNGRGAVEKIQLRHHQSPDPVLWSLRGLQEEVIFFLPLNENGFH